jgi:integrase
MARERTGSCVAFRDAHNRTRYKVGLTPPPPLKGKQKWRTLKPGTDEKVAHHTAESWNEKSAADPRKYFPELFDAAAKATLTNPTLSEYAGLYFDGRKTRNNKVERRAIENHVLPMLGDRPVKEIHLKEIRALVAGLVAGQKIFGKTIRNVYGALVTMFKRMVRDDLIIKSPCTLEAHELPALDVLSPRSRTPGAYTRGQVVTLVTDRRIPIDRLVFAALQLLTGMRHGEVAGLRWADLHEDMRPLWGIDLQTQYDRQPLKTGKPRWIPVHPVLAVMLAEWKATGFAKIYGRAPTADDYVVPTRRRGKRAMNYRKPGASLDAHTRDCENVGIVARREHDMRHTFVSLARGDGARVDMLEKVTHNAKGKMIDHYTHLEFEAKCQAVASLKLDLSESGGPCWPPIQSRFNHSSEPAGDEKPLFLAGNSATPTGIEPVLPT